MIKTCFSYSTAGLAGLILSACAASDGRYPSLAVRDAERVQGTFEPAPPSLPAAGNPVDNRQLSAPLTRAKEAHALFTARQDEVSALVTASRGLGPEDDRRAQALVGLADLTSLRGQTAVALSDLDQLEAEAATGFARTEDIREVQASILELIAQQDVTLDSLSEKLAQ